MPILATQFPTFQPAMRIIADISSSDPLIVETTFAHQYTTGMIVRLNLPPGFGMDQVNQKYAPITVTGTTTFTMPIDTTTFDPFVYPVTFPYNAQYPTVTVIGEDNAMITAAERNVLPYPLQ